MFALRNFALAVLLFFLVSINTNAKDIATKSYVLFKANGDSLYVDYI